MPDGKYCKLKKRAYKNLVCAFDIETTYLSDVEQSIMYVWQFQLDEYITIIGRTWDEFLEFTRCIADELKGNTYLVVYVHNLSYEFQFISGIYNFIPDEVFAVDSRKVLKCEMFNHIEFRCSYLQTNMSLDQFTTKMGVQNRKLTGKFDYNKKRYYYTELSNDELEYCQNDVLGLVQALKVEMENDSDNLLTIPLTSTGYVRRDVKNAIQNSVACKVVHAIYPNKQVYTMLRQAFRGGNCHANRFYAGQVLSNVHSADRSSSYPAVQLNHEYPMEEFSFLPQRNLNRDSIDKLASRGKAFIAEIRMTDVQLRDRLYPVPYLSRDRTRDIKSGIFDNGRILSCDSCLVTVTDIDYKIILWQYSFSAEFIKVAISSYGKLPKPMTDCVEDYYRKKTELKGVAGQEYFYMKSKNKLNSIYGMTAQDPVKDTQIYEDGEFIRQIVDVGSELERKRKNAFLPYQWGVWCTAWARYELELAIRLVHSQAEFVYCDTDSVKYFGEVDFSGYNEDKQKVAETHGASAVDKKGIVHYMGVYEIEETADKFVTLGAKKYCAVYDGSIKITVAGVPKKRGADELEKAGGIEQFKPGFLFRAGKLESKYNDLKEPIHYVNSDGVELDITSNIALKPTTYLLNMTDEYEQLLEHEQDFLKAISILEKTGVL